MTNASKKKGGQAKSTPTASTRRNRRMAIFRAAIIDIIANDDPVIQSIIDTVSDVIVKKLLSNGSFVDKHADKLMLKGVLDNSYCMENV